MNRNCTGKIQVTLLFVYISWKKEYLHNIKASLEEVIAMRSEKMKAKYIKEYVWAKSFFFFVKVQATISQLYYKLISSQIILRDFD